jgi:hypothetical protein
MKDQFIAKTEEGDYLTLEEFLEIVQPKEFYFEKNRKNNKISRHGYSDTI